MAFFEVGADESFYCGDDDTEDVGFLPDAETRRVIGVPGKLAE